MRYPNKNIGRWEGNASPPEEPEPPQCTHQIYQWSGREDTPNKWIQCENDVTEYIDDEPFCNGHARDLHLSHAADHQVKAAKEDPDG